MIDDRQFRKMSAELTEHIDAANEQKRLDFFAGCALAGILASLPKPIEGKTYGWEDACKDAYTGGEAMMKEREKRMESSAPEA